MPTTTDKKETPKETPRQQLRPEARPANWDKLDGGQKKAFRNLAELVVEAIGDLPEKGAGFSAQGDPYTRLSENKSSRTAFLSGGRGTGKTTVLLSLRKATEPKEFKLSSENVAADYEGLIPILRTIQTRAVWLAPLDMETISNPTKVLAAILARVGRITKHHTAAEPSYEPSGVLDPGPAFYDAFARFQRLQVNATLSLDSNLDARRGSLDADAYVVELMRGEQARLAFDEELEAVMDAIAEQVALITRIQSPLFILPVDDLDLNPQACINLLRVLRTISIPRLFTLLAGDFSVAEMVFNLQISQEFGSLTKGIGIPGLLATPVDTISKTAGELASKMIRKLLPPSQRVPLGPMTIDEALEFSPLGAASGSPRLLDIWSGCPVKLSESLPVLPTLPVSPMSPDQGLPATYVSLSEFLCATWFINPEQTSAVESLQGQDLRDRIKICPYAGKHFLAVAPRRIADLWLVFKRIALVAGESNHSEELAEAAENTLQNLGDLCLQSLCSAPLLLPDERDQVRTALTPSLTGGRLGRFPIRVESLLESAPDIDLSPGDAAMPMDIKYQCQFHFSQQTDWQFELGNLPQRQPGEVPGQPVQLGRRFLSRDSVANLALYHDLLALRSSTAHFSSPLLEPSSLAQNWAVTEWFCEHEGDFQATCLAWLPPPCTTFWELDLFLSAWNEAATEKHVPEANLKLLHRVYVWVSAGTAAVCGEIPPATPVTLTPKDWQGLSQRVMSVVKLAKDESRSRSGLGRNWLINLALLFMPETGLPAEAKSSLTGESKTALNRYAKTIQKLRAQRLAPLLLNGMEELVDQFLADVSLFGGGFRPSKESVGKAADEQAQREKRESWRKSQQPIAETRPSQVAAVKGPVHTIATEAAGQIPSGPAVLQDPIRIRKRAIESPAAQTRKKKK